MNFFKITGLILSLCILTACNFSAEKNAEPGKTVTEIPKKQAQALKGQVIKIYSPDQKMFYGTIALQRTELNKKQIFTTLADIESGSYTLQINEKQNCRADHPANELVENFVPIEIPETKKLVAGVLQPSLDFDRLQGKTLIFSNGKTVACGLVHKKE